MKWVWLANKCLNKKCKEENDINIKLLSINCVIVLGCLSTSLVGEKTLKVISLSCDKAYWLENFKCIQYDKKPIVYQTVGFLYE